MKGIKHILLLTGVLFSFLLWGFMMTSLEQETIEFITFMEMVENEEVKSVGGDFEQDKHLLFETTEGKIYQTDNPKSTDFKRELLEMGVEVIEKNSNSVTELFSLLINLMLPILILLVLMKSMQGFSKDPEPLGDKPKTKLEDVKGLKEVKEDIQLLVDFLKNPTKFKERGAKLPKGVIFYGSPGTGKTLLARAIAGEANVPFFHASGSDFIELYAGLGAKRVRKLFETARKQTPCIIFIDEIDAIGGKREGLSGNSEQRQTINAMLAEMDGFNDSSNVLVIAATNRLEDLDAALIRPGRFDKHICVPLPETPEERLEILSLYQTNRNFSDDVDFEALAKETIGFSPADLESMMNEAALISIQLEKEVIDRECFDQAIYKKLLKGHAKKEHTSPEEQLRLVAWHEAGHTVAALHYGFDVSKVTIIPSTTGAGGVTFITPKKMGLHTVEELEASIRKTYAGRGGEYLLLQDEQKITTGAHNDIKQATQLLYEMVTEYGMSKRYRMVNLNDLKVDSKTILDEVTEWAKRLEKETYDLLNQNKDLVEAIANALLEHETLYTKDLETISNIVFQSQKNTLESRMEDSNSEQKKTL